MENFSTIDLTKPITTLEEAIHYIRGRDLLSIGLATDRSSTCVRLTLLKKRGNPVIEKLIIEVAESKRKGMLKRREIMLKEAEADTYLDNFTNENIFKKEKGLE